MKILTSTMDQKMLRIISLEYLSLSSKEIKLNDTSNINDPMPKITSQYSFIK